MGTAEQVPLLAKMLPLPDGGRRELITFLWEELHSQIFARCFKFPALYNCPALYYSLLFSTEAPLPGQIDNLEIGRKTFPLRPRLADIFRSMTWAHLGVYDSETRVNNLGEGLD